MKHTKGPWSIDKYNTVIDSQGNTIRTEGFALSMRSDEETKANARLMASAPELLEALQAMVQWQMDSMSGKPTKGYPGTQAMQAIAKALGQP